MFKIAVLCLLFPLFSHAEIAPVDNLRTFFTAKQTRTQLDDLRSSGKYSKNSGSASILREPAKVKMQGVVIRDGKTPVVFVNNENTLKTHHLSNEVTVRDHKIKKQDYKISVRVNQQGVTLKPGQQWDESSRKVEDSYRIKPAKVETSDSASFIKKVDNLIN